MASAKRKFPVLEDFIVFREKIAMLIIFVIVPTIMNGIKHHLIMWIEFLNQITLESWESVVVLFTSWAGNSVIFSWNIKEHKLF